MGFSHPKVSIRWELVLTRLPCPQCKCVCIYILKLFILYNSSFKKKNTFSSYDLKKKKKKTQFVMSINCHRGFVEVLIYMSGFDKR